MKSIGIFGIGSPFGEDNLGQIVISQLAYQLRHDDIEKHIQMDFYDRPGIDLLELIKDFKTVHLIDAIVSDKPLGYIHRYDDVKTFQGNARTLSSHGFGVVEVLALGEMLNRLPDKLVIHGIEINGNMQNPVISEKVFESCRILAKKIAEECYSHCAWDSHD